ncbi:hypothetical protein HBB16_10265 [Pseudonocardia sp. MCCB 268]|nr:hypothetical protein [Pseudonocardia cytotoxica]
MHVVEPYRDRSWCRRAPRRRAHLQPGLARDVRGAALRGMLGAVDSVVVV